MWRDRWTPAEGKRGGSGPGRHHWLLCPGPGGDHVALAKATRSLGAGAALFRPYILSWAAWLSRAPGASPNLFPSILWQEAPGEPAPTPHPTPAVPFSSPLWTELPLRGCLPVADRADMGSVGETQLRWAILGFLLLQGKRHPPPSFSSSSPVASSSGCLSLLWDTHSTQALHPGLHSPGGKFQSLVMKGITWLGSWSFPGSS